MREHASGARTSARQGEALGSELDANVASLRVEHQHADAAFPADTRPFRLAERCAQVAQEPTVDPDDPGLDPPAEPMGS